MDTTSVTTTTNTMSPVIPDVGFYEDIGAKYESAYAHDVGLIALIETATQLLASKRARILDAGCGTGRPTSATLAAAGHEVHGIDVAQNMVNISARQVPLGRFEQGDMLHWETSPPLSKEGTFDAVFALFSLFLLSRADMETVIHKWQRWVNPGGLLFVGTMAADDSEAQGKQARWHADGKSADNFRYKFMGIVQSMTLFTKAGWKDALESRGFEIVETRDVPFEPPAHVECELEPHHFIIARRV